VFGNTLKIQIDGKITLS